MFELFKIDSDLDDLMKAAIAEMNKSAPNSEQYSNALTSLERLMKLKESKKTHISPDTIALVLGNLLGILIIVAYEQKHVMGSKGLGFVLKPKN